MVPLLLPVVSDVPDPDQQLSSGLQHAGALHRPLPGPLREPDRGSER